jgi:hypothetical protein
VAVVGGRRRESYVFIPIKQAISNYWLIRVESVAILLENIFYLKIY